MPRSNAARAAPSCWRSRSATRSLRTWCASTGSGRWSGCSPSWSRRFTGWGFGITTDARRPKAAAAVVREWARRPLEALRASWPSISVVVCAYNEERRLASCLKSLLRCNYPGLEVVVCDDGSTDGTLEVAYRFPFRVLALPHGGLSRARNAGLAATRGRIVAYLDGDAQCHPDWPFYLALA